MASLSPAKSNWFLTSIAILAAGILPVVLLEAGLRIFHFGYPTSFFIPIGGAQAFTSSYRFGWRFFPASIARVPVVSYLPAPKQSGHYRIFVLGDSAAMGIPEPAFSFARMLRVMLEARHAGTKFEIVNTAMTAINSHVMLPIARDSAGLEPDMFIVLAGNNEVVGPYGPGTVLAGYSPSLPLIRASIWFKSTRTAQLMERFVPHGDAHEKWGGMAMFTGHQVAHDDARLSAVYRNFQSNLEAVARIAHGANAAIVFSTVPVNLKDTPPFASRNRVGLNAVDLAGWQRLYEDGKQKARAGDCAGALPEFQRAIQLDGEFADLRYQAGRCQLALGAEVEASVQLTAARDLDTLRFRADSRINEAIRAVAGAQLVDAARDLAPLPGNELFFEHVHLRFEGNYRLALLMLSKVEAALPAAVQSTARNVPVAQAEVAAALGFTEWDRDKSEMEMLTMMQQPPFAREAATQEKLSDLQRKWSSPERLAGLRGNVEQYERALRQNPGDPELREMLAELLSKSGDDRAAAQQYRKLTALVPDVARWHVNLAHALLQTAQLTEAQNEAQTALRLDPQSAAAQFTLAGIAERAGNLSDAVARYEETLRADPDYSDAYLRLGVVLGKLGRYREAVDRYRQYLRLAPGSAQVENNVGVLLVRLGDVAAAEPHYREALHLNPDFAEAANNLGAALERLGRKGEGIVYYRLALQIRPEFPQARQHLEQALKNR